MTSTDKSGCMKEPKDFTHTCVFERQLTYLHIQDNLYLVDMESGRSAVYERRIKDGSSYRGTGQHDWDFSFIRYMDASEFEVVQTKTPMGFSKITVKLNDGVKI